MLITGGTDSFGKAFTRMVNEAYASKKIISFSRDYLKQYDKAQPVREPHIH